MSRAGIGKASTAKIEKKVATAKNQLSKKIVASGLYNFLLATTIDEGVITKLKED